ncbi:MAG: hypothetical protein RIS34_1560 [Pseudomonadota bacterium]|jgi:uncharacterized protein YbjT (DUF2867 family)
MKRILVLGGSGFVGRHLCEKVAQLNARFDTRLTVVTRRLAHAKAIQTLPWVDLAEADVHDGASLMRLVAGHDAVVNLVAILHGNQDTFNRAHVELVRKLVRACQANSVQRIVHVSALGAAPDAPSMYQRSKAEAEAVLAASGLDVTVLRPSVIFGADDKFLNVFAKLQSIFPVMPLAGAQTRFQPVWVEDVAQAVVNVLQRHELGRFQNDSRLRNIYEACGPERFTLKQLVQLAGHFSGHPRPVFGLPPALGRLQARMMALAPGEPLMSLDNLDAMAVDNVASGKLPGLQALDIAPTSLHAIAPLYLRP